MRTNRFGIIRPLAIVAAVASVVVILAQRRAFAAAKMSHDALARAAAEGRQLQADNVELSGLRATNEEVRRLRQVAPELARLRNEVEGFRKRAGEAARMRADNERLEGLLKQSASDGGANIMPANYHPRSQMADAGLATPEATVQTYLWATSRGDVARLRQCSTEAGEESPQQQEFLSQSLIKEFETFPGFFIGDEKTISTNEAEINVRATPDGVAFPFHLLCAEGEWKVKN